MALPLNPDLRRRAFTQVATCYLTALAAAIAAGALTADQHVLLVIAAADVAATLTVFAFSAATRNASFYDPYWSVAPPLIAAWLWFDGAASIDWRPALVMLAIWVWAVRLTGNWARGWRGLDHVDWRYVELKQKLGMFWMPVNLLGIHLMPTVLVYLGCLPLDAVLYAPARPLNWLDLLATVVTAAAIWIETRADRELHAFRQSRQSSAQMLATGGWSWCRHPNYLGELGFWFGLFLFALAASSNAWWTGTGIAAMVLLFAGISIPMQERKLTADKPDYVRWRKRSFALLPLSRFRKKLRPETA